MPTQDLGPTGQRTAKNFSDLRKDGGPSLRAMSALLDELGRPIPPASLMKIEKGTRRVDVDDLVALALALNVTPNRLLLTPEGGPGEVGLTSDYSAPSKQLAWLWACGYNRLSHPGQDRPRTMAESLQFNARNRPFDVRDADLVDTIERHRDALAPIAKAARAARAKGVDAKIIVDYLRLTDVLDVEGDE